jgi:hypothetical protein
MALQFQPGVLQKGTAMMTKDLRSLRRENLRRLIDQHGGPTSMARVLKHANASYLSQLAGPNPTREVSEKAARRIEEQMGLPFGFLDTECRPDWPIETATESRQVAPEGKDVDTDRLVETLTAVFEVCRDRRVLLAPRKLADVVAMAYSSSYRGDDLVGHSGRLVNLAV